MDRKTYLDAIEHNYRTHPIVALLGPRQCGKTTLAKQYLKSRIDLDITYFDLEDPVDLLRLETPKSTLESLEGLVVIDEVQRIPELFPVLRVLVDREDNKTNFLILGSASRDLIRQSSETLAGRIAYLELTPFSFAEVGGDLHQLWMRGGFPPAYLAQTEADSVTWRKHYISTFLERDIPNLGIQIPPASLRRFWMMLLHYHANIFNASEIGRSLGIADTTVKRYLDVLTGTFMIRRLIPWYQNSNKREVKSSKIYFRDSGILHHLMDVKDYSALLHHPKLGASWEGFALEEVIRHLQVAPEECYFWAVHNQAELDLLVFKNGKRLGFEFKYSDAPRLTTSMTSAFEVLNLDTLTVIYPGGKDYSLRDNIRVVGLKNY